MSLVAAALFPAILIATLFYFLDKNPEPVKEVIRAFFVGILSVVVTLIVGYTIIIRMEIDGSFGNSFINSFWNAAFVEELAKFAVFMLFIYRRRHYDEWYDGILYGIMVGLGFAFIENILYFTKLFDSQGWSIVWVRSIFSMPVHAMLGGIMGFFVGWAKFKTNKHFSRGSLFLALAIPISLHGFFNFFLMLWRQELAIISFILSISMWFIVLKMKKRSQQAG